MIDVTVRYATGYLGYHIIDVWLGLGVVSHGGHRLMCRQAVKGGLPWLPYN